jgi:hypothetical protein
MVDFHNKTFFGKNSALIVQSSTRKDPSTFFKFFQKKRDESWERPSEGEGLTIKFAMKELVFLLRVMRKEVLKWTTMHEFKQKATNFHIEWTLDDTLKLITQNYSVELDIGQSEVLKMLLSHILEEKVIHATSSETPVKERQTEEEEEPKITVEEVVQEPSAQKSAPKKAKKKAPKKQPSKREGKKRTELKGFIEGETKKALLINFGGEKAQWIPKSTVHSEFSSERGIEQSFLIDDWVLKKNNII